MVVSSASDVHQGPMAVNSWASDASTVAVPSVFPRWVSAEKVQKTAVHRVFLPPIVWLTPKP